jgi:hypothetical protein
MTVTKDITTEQVAQYAAPKLEVYGEMATLTAGGTSGQPENLRPNARRRA